MRQCLVVDDSSVIRKVTRRIMEDMNFDILEAENGQEALEHCKVEMPDVIMLDWDMPVMGAFEFLSALRLSTNSKKKATIFYCTTENNVDDISRAFNHGADEYILKPYDRDTLAAKLSSAGLI